MNEDANRTDKPPAEDRLSLLWRRVKDHRIAQWTVGYVAVAYAIQHGVVLTTESLDWPHSVERVSMLTFLLGLPLVVVFAWYHGERTTRRISRGELSIVSVLLVGIAILFYVFVRPAAQTNSPARQESVASSPATNSGQPAEGISLAVLPFANLSDDREQEFFSDGMTDEIMSALAKVQSINIVARESAYQFKGENKDMRSVGQALNAQYLINGSVRKSGDRVRITAQLVRANTGVSIWTENYDRELKDVFAVQEDIAQAIAASLRVPLGLQQGQSLVSNRTTDLDSYQQYLQARGLIRQRGEGNNQAIAILETVTGKDPQFAPAWSLLAYAYALSPANLGKLRTGSVEEARSFIRTYLDKAEDASRTAIRLDPKHAGGYFALAYTQAIRGHWLEAEDLFKRAVALDPNDPETLHEYSVILAYVGRIKESLTIRTKLLLLEPFVPIFKINTATYLQDVGRTEEAIKLLEPVPSASGQAFGRNIVLAHAYASQGQFKKAADTLLLIPASVADRQTAEAAARLLLTAPSQAAQHEDLPPLTIMSFVYVYVGAADHVMDYYEHLLSIGYSLGGNFWFADYAPVRKTNQFKAYMRAAGYVDYWKARGWPDLCRPVGADDFECD